MSGPRDLPTVGRAGTDDTQPPRREWLGVIGGMGPLATADFLAKLVEATPAASDQEHIPVLVHGDPRVPDRTDALLHRGVSPLPSLVEAVRFLNRCQVGIIAMPCNSAHAWFEELRAVSEVPILDMVSATSALTDESAPASGAIGVLATAGTERAGLYHRDLRARGWDLVEVDPEQRRDLDRGIAAVKAGDVVLGRQLVERVAHGLVGQGAAALVAACTEVSAVLDAEDDDVPVPLIDSSTALALACVRALSANGGSRTREGTQT